MPAATSYAGDGEPGFAGDPEWETYMQLTGDAGLEVRIPVQAGSRVVGVSFVREMWEPEGLPQPMQLGRVIANDQVYMGNANVGSVQIGGPYQVPGAAESREEHGQPQSDFRLPAAQGGCGRTRLRRDDSLENGSAGLPASGDESGHRTRCWSSSIRAGRTAEAFDNGIQFALERMLVDPGFPAARASRSGNERLPRTGSAIWNWPRACRSFCGAAFPTITC